jgi:hypothetical protein
MPPNRDSVKLAVSTLFFLMAIRPASTARISRPAKKKGSKALTELWSPNMIGEGYISDAELEDAQVQLMCYQEGVDFQKHRKSPPAALEARALASASKQNQTADSVSKTTYWITNA